MSEIKKLLTKRHLPFIQPQLNWGKITITEAQLPPEATGKQVVYVECRPQSQQSSDFLIDHHNELSHRPSSLLQVLKLLGQTPTLRQQLIASIDSNFLSYTIKKYPQHKSQIIRIWESGYRKNFPTLSAYQQFRRDCETLIKQAARPYPDLLIIYQSPQSMTLLAALCNLQQLSCILIVGSFDSEKPKPCFYQGPPHVIKQLAAANWHRAYWGRRYFGCRAIPVQFVTYVTQIYRSQK